MKEITRRTIIIYCLPQFAVGLFTAMLNNYLIYFYQPTQASGLPVLITQGYVFAGVLTVIGLIKAVGHIIDAFSDPIVASISDKCKHKSGRRIPFMKWFAVPFALSALLIFWSLFENPVFNNIWLAVFIWLYYICYTFYMIPHNALHIKNFSAISCIAVYFACRNGRTHINRDLPLCFVAFCRNMHIMKCTQ